jgi:hypothetical protein
VACILTGEARGAAAREEAVLHRSDLRRSEMILATSNFQIPVKNNLEYRVEVGEIQPSAFRSSDPGARRKQALEHFT